MLIPKPLILALKYSFGSHEKHHPEENQIEEGLIPEEHQLAK